MIINRIYEHQNHLSLQLVSFMVGLRTYQHHRTFVTDSRLSETQYNEVSFQSRQQFIPVLHSQATI
jgi:hypothetical protein